MDAASSPPVVGGGSPLGAPAVQAASPTAGQTVVMTDSAVDGTLYLTPAGTLATLTVTLPTEVNSRIGQIRRIGTSQALTLLTIGGATTILGNVTTLALGASASFQKVAANTWIRVV